MNYYHTLHLLQLLLAVYCVLKALESLIDYDRYTEAGILSWQITRVQYERSWLKGILDRCFTNGRYRYFLYFHLVGGITLGIQALFSLGSGVLPLFVILITTLSIGFRHHAGLNGDYQMSIVVIFGLLVGSYFGNDPVGRLMIYFIALHSILSYSISGWLKLNSSGWRDGTVIERLCESETWMSETAYQIVTGVPGSSTFASWSVILLECLFPVVLVVPQNIMWVIFIIGISFHVTTALFMGFNSFLILYPTTYIAISYANAAVHSTF